MTNSTGRRTVKSVEKAFDVLEYLRDENGTTVSAIANHLPLSPGSVHTHLTTLKQRGYVVQEGDEYRLGPLLLPLGEHVRNKSVIYRAASDQIDKLAETTDECAHLVVNHGGRLVTLYEAFGGNAVGTEYHAKKREEPISHHHCTAVGKAMLSQYDDDRVSEVLDQHGMVERTPNTITDRDEFYEELREARERGFAISDEEQIVGIRAVGAPITTSDGEVPGGISVSGPASRLTQETIRDEIAEQVNRASNISEVNVHTSEQ